MRAPARVCGCALLTADAQFSLLLPGLMRVVPNVQTGDMQPVAAEQCIPIYHRVTSLCAMVGHHLRPLPYFSGHRVVKTALDKQDRARLLAGSGSQVATRVGVFLFVWSKRLVASDASLCRVQRVLVLSCIGLPLERFESLV